MCLLKYPRGLEELPHEQHSSGIAFHGDKKTNDRQRGGNLREDKILPLQKINFA